MPRIQDLPTVEERREATEHARRLSQEYYAGRAVDDPVKLARAARIIRAALARKRITLAELTADEATAA